MLCPLRAAEAAIATILSTARIFDAHGCFVMLNFVDVDVSGRRFARTWWTGNERTVPTKTAAAALVHSNDCPVGTYH